MKKEVLEILDKNIDQEGLAKDLGKLLVKQPLEAYKAKVQSGEVDLIKGTDLDKEVVLKVLDLALAQLG